MKRIGPVLMVIMLLLACTQSADAYEWGRWHHGRGWTHPYIAAPLPAPYIRPYYAPPAPIVRERWVPPHWRHTPYGDRRVPGHYARPY